MLQVRNPKPIDESYVLPSNEISVSDQLDSLVSLVRRRLGILVLIFSLSVMCGAVYLFTAPPKFQARAELLIDAQRSQLFQQQPLAGDSPMDSAAVDSQIQVLKSE